MLRENLGYALVNFLDLRMHEKYILVYQFMFSFVHEMSFRVGHTFQRMGSIYQ